MSANIKVKSFKINMKVRKKEQKNPACIKLSEAKF
jgi:hypothetical protein